MIEFPPLPLENLLPKEECMLPSCEQHSFKQELEKVAKTEEEETKKKRGLPFAPLPPLPVVIENFYRPETQKIEIKPLTSVQCDWIVAEMANVIEHKMCDGVREISIRLEGTTFTHTPLEGTRLIIKEFSTAPRQFNIEFHGSEKAITLIQQGLEELRLVFANHNENSFNGEKLALFRIETFFEESSPFFFKRKAPVGEGGTLG